MIMCMLLSASSTHFKWEIILYCLHSPTLNKVFLLLLYAQIKENTKAPRHWPLWGESTNDRWFPSLRANNTENGSFWWRHHAREGWYIQPILMLICRSFDTTYLFMHAGKDISIKPRLILSDSDRHSQCHFTRLTDVAGFLASRQPFFNCVVSMLYCLAMLACLTALNANLHREMFHNRAVLYVQIIHCVYARMDVVVTHMHTHKIHWIRDLLGTPLMHRRLTHKSTPSGINNSILVNEYQAWLRH